VSNTGLDPVEIPNRFHPQADSSALTDAQMTPPDGPDAVSKMADNVRTATRRRSAAYVFPWLRAGYMMQFQEIERAVLREVSRYFCGLEGLKILDIGCGAGAWLREFIKWGADPKLMVGIDAIEERIAEARHLTPPAVHLVCGNAASLEAPKESFDLVMLFECLCMMTDHTTRKQMASEALRVLKNDGVILFYDFRYRRPGLGDVFRPLGMREIKDLFPQCTLRIRSIHPFPPLSRKFAAVTPGAWHLLNLVPALRTSYFGSIRKAPSTDQALELEYARLLKAH
jgi:SAM-dependent methyltransferase